MKKLITTILIILFYVYPVNAKEEKQKWSSIETVCIGGYLFAVVLVISPTGSTSVDMEQIFKGLHIKKPFPPQPIKCKEKK